jgi:hypothetical protein
VKACEDGFSRNFPFSFGKGTIGFMGGYLSFVPVMLPYFYLLVKDPMRVCAQIASMI